jgi:hypothetical protein
MLVAPPLAVSGETTLLGVAAIITAISGVISTILGARKARREERARAEEECFQKLKAARVEAEEAAAELHEIKMKKTRRAK